jgi:heme o synthase
MNPIDQLGQPSQPLTGASAAHPVVRLPSHFAQYYALTKPRVVQLIVFCALIGMALAVPGMPTWPDLKLALFACAGIWLVAGAAAAFNCLVEQPRGDQRPGVNSAIR